MRNLEDHDLYVLISQISVLRGGYVLPDWEDLNGSENIYVRYQGLQVVHEHYAWGSIVHENEERCLNKEPGTPVRGAAVRQGPLGACCFTDQCCAQCPSAVKQRHEKRKRGHY